MITLWCKHSTAVAILERELATWKDLYKHERRSKEQAIDELLRVRVQVGPVSLSTPTEDSEIERLMKTTEFSQAGEIGE